MILDGMRHIESREHLGASGAAPHGDHSGFRQAKEHLWLLLEIVFYAQKHVAGEAGAWKERCQCSVSPPGANSRAGAVGTAWREGDVCPRGSTAPAGCGGAGLQHRAVFEG